MRSLTCGLADYTMLLKLVLLLMPMLVDACTTRAQGHGTRIGRNFAVLFSYCGYWRGGERVENETRALVYVCTYQARNRNDKKDGSIRKTVPTGCSVDDG